MKNATILLVNILLHSGNLTAGDLALFNDNNQDRIIQQIERILEPSGNKIMKIFWLSPPSQTNPAFELQASPLDTSQYNSVKLKVKASGSGSFDLQLRRRKFVNGFNEYFISNIDKFLSRPIDGEWQEILIPLSEFKSNVSGSSLKSSNSFITHVVMDQPFGKKNDGTNPDFYIDDLVLSEESPTEVLSSNELGSNQEIQSPDSNQNSPSSTNLEVNTDGGSNCQNCIPIDSMTTNQTYKNFKGGLYPEGNNVPLTHHQEGLRLATNLKPLDANGNVNLNGKIVFMSAGFSNSNTEFCGGGDSGGTNGECRSSSFMGRLYTDDEINRENLVIINGAARGMTLGAWSTEQSSIYERVFERLTLAHLNPKQVQVIWLKCALQNPTISLPSETADARNVQRSIGSTVRLLKIKFPNLKMVFLSSRTYGGYSAPDSTLNPEPYAYEGGFGVKWAIESQIKQMASSPYNRIDPIAGDLNYNSVSPWLVWGPYLWAQGDLETSNQLPNKTPYFDLYENLIAGISFKTGDFIRSDGVHPGSGAIEKVGGALINFFKTSSYTKNWFIK